MNKIENLKKFFKSKKPKSVEDYQNAMKEFGLVNDLASPSLYGDERVAMLTDRNDLGIYQTPVQFAGLLKFLEKFTINSYTEIGIFRGGTFLFMKYFLQAKNPNVVLHAIDPTDNIHPDAKPKIEPYLIKGTSDNVSGIAYDCVLIDGDHSYQWTKRDYENIGRLATICIFHDINEPSCPDVKTFWNELKQQISSQFDKQITEFTDTIGGANHQGIGVIY